MVVTFTGAPAGMTATGGTLVGNVLTIPAANVGTASITVPADYAGTFSASAVANTNEGSSVSDSFDVTVSATAEPITANDVGGAETDAAVAIPLALSAAYRRRRLRDADRRGGDLHRRAGRPAGDRPAAWSTTQAAPTR